MLSRVADSLYWMSRYLERAEHSARLIDVQLNLMLDQSTMSDDQRWRRVLACLGPAAVTEENPTEAQRISHMLSLDTTSRSSIVSCITEARENARQVREQISSEMWEQINRLFHDVKRPAFQSMWESQPIEFLHSIREKAHSFQGVTDSTMSHGEGWQFIQLGRFIERAMATATLLDVQYAELEQLSATNSDPGEHLEWIGLLKSCTAFEAYCKVYTAEIRSMRIAEFLLLNAEFPHSVRFSIDMVASALSAIGTSSPARKADRAQKLTGRMRASLNFSQIDEVIGGGLHGYLENIQKQCNQIHSAINQIYVNYPIQSALEA
jgi:uncharacterized alpha-E superfamily protein